jgi:hypothetical protein
MVSGQSPSGRPANRVGCDNLATGDAHEISARRMSNRRNELLAAIINY